MVLSAITELRIFPARENISKANLTERAQRVQFVAFEIFSSAE